MVSLKKEVNWETRKAVVEDFTIWIIIGLLVLALGGAIAYFALKKGNANLGLIKSVLSLL